MTKSFILTINGGSSTIKFGAFRANGALERILTGRIERIGSPAPEMVLTDLLRGETQHPSIRALNHSGAAFELIELLGRWAGGAPFQAIGHRIVHGGLRSTAHQAITPDLFQELCRARPLDPDHLPREIALIAAFRKEWPDVVQVACFDSVFHRTLPRLAQMLPIPRRYFEAGVRRLGFHGLSYAYLIEELRRIAGTAAEGRVILAHLGSGASMTALHRGTPIDTSMAFTPASGIMMGTRPGDLDPGVLLEIMGTEKLTPVQADEFINSRCGLVGVSGTTPDMRELLSRRAQDESARDAFELFCYEAKKRIGAYAAALGGLDTLVFAGGIGEGSPEVRATICDGLGFLGIHIDQSRNAECNRDGSLISTPDSQVAVRVIPTDEEVMVARIVRSLVAKDKDACIERSETRHPQAP